ncbi:hypothetical protein LMG27174_01867 [Paraburkholderia rhynchosiae]|uniref:Uncharacterized protein n=1 Tax=Paraburkholderia rhynchosiae TaxID=487049 RepID=A0A6J5AM04_9BURK|nr:hypothetical protein LMG27174_01867 [Paraburkholderia rhynchosiae]
MPRYIPFNEARAQSITRANNELILGKFDESTTNYCD